MLELLGLILVAVGAAVVLLPFLTFVRLHRLSREVERLRQRLDALERQRAEPFAHPGPAAAPAASAASAEARTASDRAPEPAPRAEDRAAPSSVPAAAATSTALPGEGSPLGERPHRPAPSDPGRERDLEAAVGGRGLLYIGVLILLLGVSFFLKYAFDNAWIGPAGRVTLGLLAGAALTWGGLGLDRRGLAAFGQALAGTGIAILYLSIYAALAFYGLIGRPMAFGAMVVVTALAAGLADRRRALSLAMLAVGGGFLTPFLVGGDRDAQITLFTCDALLVTGTLLLARRHGWALLQALSYVLTLASVAIWADTYYLDPKWATTLVFLSIFCALFGIMLRDARRIPGALARFVRGLLWTAPLLYHAAALVITSDHPPAFHIYLIAFTLTGLLLTASPSRPWLRVGVLLAALLPLFGYVLLPEGPSWLVANLVTIVAICGLHLMVLVERVSRRNEPLTLGDLLALHLTGLGLFGLLQRTLAAPFPAAGGSVALAIAAVAALLWFVFQPRDRLAALNAAALAMTLVAVAIALQFDGRVVVIGWATEGGVVAWLGLRAPSRAYLAGGLGLWAAAALRLTDNYFATPVNFTAVVNERSLATLSVIAIGYAMVRLISRHAAVLSRPEWLRAALHVAASLLSLLWISAEIGSYWEVREDRPQAYLYREVLLSLGWALYGAIVIVVGMQRAYAPLRYIGMVVIGTTVLKVFFVDLWDLGGIYRVVGFLALGILLVLVSYLYQSRKRPAAASSTAEPSEG